MSNSKPNIILINCDDLGYGDLGCYGSELHNTPALDRMAREGIRFTDFYMASPVCSPSRGAMMTGCYPPRIGFGQFEDRQVLFPGQGIGLNPQETTIARALKNEGYSTMLVGKWHCGDQLEFLPARHGFDHYYGLPYSNGMGRKVSRPHLPPLPLMCDEQVLQEQPDQTSLTERYTEQAVRFIREHKAEPFFLYFAHTYVHVPLYVPERFLEQSQNGSYGAAVECIDWVADVLLNELKRQGIERETLVIFTSDNGSRSANVESNKPLRGGKANTWEGGMRVPCIMYWPGTIPPGAVCSELTTAMDFYPTLIHLVGGTVPPDREIDGKDIRPLIFQEADAISPHSAFFYYYRNNLEAVRSGKWKLHVWKREREIRELYDLSVDIGESDNVYEQHPQVVKELDELLNQCRQDLGDEVTGIRGKHCRPAGTVSNPRPLTEFDENYPYFNAMYD